MKDIDQHTLVRAAGLYMPIVVGGVAWAIRRTAGRQLVGALMSMAWLVPALFALHVIALKAGWWDFDATGGTLMRMPVDLWLAWAILWGPVAAIVFRTMPLVAVALVALAIDLILMPAAFPVVRLGPQWLIGEAAAIVSCLLPAQLLARWTASDRHVAGRAMLQVVAFSVLIASLLPAAAIELSGSTWRNPFEWPRTLLSVVIQLLGMPAILGLSAVQEFVTRGGGTPIPYDPPRRIVTTGAYAYVANPMQLSTAVLLIGIGAVVSNVFVAAAGIMSVIYSAGIAHWDEDSDLRKRFGNEWETYRRNVRRWLPRWRPWYRHDAPMATLYVAEECGMCREVASWYQARGARGLAIVAAEDHPSSELVRITYESMDGLHVATGTNAIARALEHIHFGWAFTGFVMRLPALSTVIQLIVDASGGHPRPARRKTILGP